MHINDWLKIYKPISKQLGLEEAKDGAATVQLSLLLDSYETFKLVDLSAKLKGKPVIIYGAGPSLASDLDTSIGLGLCDSVCNIASDGAVTAFLDRGRLPDLIFTDLDGPMGDIRKACEGGSWIVVHAHGDNIPALKEHVPTLGGPLIGSTQVYPLPPKVLNLGGFTDGDRPVFWSAELNASRIMLMGMDFGTTIGPYSKPQLEGAQLQRKIHKLEIGRQLIGILAAKREIWNLTGSGSPIDNVRNMKPADAKSILKVKS